MNPDSGAAKKIDSAMGGRFTVTLRNSTKNYIHYTFNGQKQILLLPDYQRTHTGVGNAEVQFDVGAGNGSIRSYNLGSGRTYHFQYRQEQAIDWRAGGSFLDLFRD